MHQLPLQIDSLDINKPGPWPWLIGLTALFALIFCVFKDASNIEQTIKSSAIATVAASKGFNVSTQVDGRDVVLQGTLSSDIDRQQLVESISGIDGVRVVNDDIKEYDPRAQAKLDRLQFQQSVSNIDASSISFKPNSASLSLSSESALLGVAKLLKGSPERQIKVAGHTDNSGNAERNLELSRHRAQAVADFLYARGINKRQIIVQGYGSTKPLHSNDTGSGRAQNRRIEFIFMN